MRRALIVVAALLALAGAGFAAVEAGVPLGGISRGDAVSVAMRQVEVQSSTRPSLQWAVPGLFGWFRGGTTDAVAPWYRAVWSIRFGGTFQGSCTPAPVLGTSHCPPADHTETVILDYRTGRFIMATIEP